MSLWLPEGGKYLPKVVKISDSITIMDVIPLQMTVHDTVLMMSNIHTMGFNETFRERATGTQRPRMNESCIDPDLLHFNIQEVSRIIDMWKMDGIDETQLNQTINDGEKWR